MRQQRIFTARPATAGRRGAQPLSARMADGFFASLTGWRLSVAVQLTELLLIVILAIAVFPASRPHGGLFPLHYLLAAGIVAIVSHYSFIQAGLYQVDLLADPPRAMKALSLRWTMVFVLMAALAALTHEPDQYSRLWFSGFYLGGMAVLGGQRWLIGRLIRAWIERGYHTLSVAIVGGNHLAEQLIEKFAHNPWGIRIIGVFDDRSGATIRSIRGASMLGTIADLLEYSRHREVDLVVVTLPLVATARIQVVIRQLRQQPLNVRVLPGAIGLERISPIRLARTELPGVQLIAVADRPITEFALFAKGLFDRAAAASALFVLSPVLIGCAMTVRLSSPGPVLFRQTRVGYKGRDFQILKFRTMHIAPGPHTMLTQRGDARVFTFGRLLRKFSLDELPQLFNVLKGDMSLVGPRPHMPEARAAGTLYFDAVTEYADRQRVKPGLTGWAQINGWRGPTETLEQIERRVEHDIYYIDNWSLLLDAVIIVRTICGGFGGQNAF